MTIESGTEEYGYAPGYYWSSFYYPDGIKLEGSFTCQTRKRGARINSASTQLGAIAGR